MIVGSGMLATAFDAPEMSALGATIFASGVSNSNETRPEAFAREAELLARHVADCKGTFVYFSTCSVADPDRRSSDYARHKLQMEAQVVTAERFLVLRLPQVVGRTANPHTLTNFICNRIRSGQPFPVWEHAQRCMVDVDHVALITTSLLQRGTPINVVAEIAPPETVAMGELVKLMEDVLERPARCDRVARGGGSTPDPTLAIASSRTLGIDLSAGYTRRLLAKYYGPLHAD